MISERTRDEEPASLQAAASFVDIAVVDIDDAYAWGFSGVMVRGSGVAWDLRKSQPYECYEEMEFDIPVGKNGDNYDRQMVRMEEMRQSIHIMKQCIAKLRAPDGQGAITTTDGKFAPPTRGEMKRSMEALIHHFKLTRKLSTVRGEVLRAAWTAPKANSSSISSLTPPTNRIPACKTSAPGALAHLTVVPLQAHMPADGPSSPGSIDIVFAIGR